jgi:hypothetical protein
MSMGYTHYWKQTRNLTPAEMEDIAGVIHKINDSTDVLICGWNGEGEPDLGPDLIRFNGPGDEGHETFYIGPDKISFAYCKTERKPYDIVVTALLTVLAADYGFGVSSDGNLGDWEHGVRLASKAMGKVYRNPLRKEAA